MRNFKKTIFFLTVFIALLLIIVPLSFASNGITVLINDQERQFSPEPVIQNGGTLVPMRPFFEALGCQVKWDAGTKTAVGIRDNQIVKLPIGSSTAFVNDQAKQLSVKAQIIKGSTFIPLRFVGEALGDQVNWNGKTRTIVIYSTKIPLAELLKVHFIDVGQADSIYIQAPDHYDILIDGGNNADGSTVVNYLKSQGVDDIEIMVATHNHEDHIGGLDDVMFAFDVERIIDSGQTGATKTYKDYWSAVQAEGAKYQEDDDMVFDIGHGIKFFVIETGDNYSNVNNNSVLTKLDYNNIEVLFTGDMEADVESSILTKDIQADILKVGHHGSRSSTSEVFLSKVNPATAVISVGKDNSYGHPTPDILKRLDDRGITTYRTDVSGTIVVATDGNTYTVDKIPCKYTGSTSGGTVTTIPVKPSSNGKYTASSKSNKFHLPACRYAASIKSENKIWFQTRDEAIKAGYQPCSVCKP